jgi:ribosomal protein L20
LWITQINAATQVYNIFNSYSKLIRNWYHNFHWARKDCSMSCQQLE